jgi:uncharacterized protein YaaQ
MKLLMVIVEDSHKEEVEALLGRCGLGYTEISPTVGAGATGPRLGSRAFPKTSAVVFSLAGEESLARLRSEIQEFCEGCGERVKMMVLGVEEVVM